MLEEKKGLLISRSLLMFRRQSLQQEITFSLFFFFSFYHFQMIKVDGLCVYKYETRVFLFHTNPVEPLRRVRVLLSACHLWAFSHCRSVETDGTETTQWGPTAVHAVSFKDFMGKDCFLKAPPALAFCSIGVLCGLSCTHETRLALSFLSFSLRS